LRSGATPGEGRRLRVIHVIAGAGLGGVETFVRNTALHTDRDEIDLAVCVLGADGPLSAALREADVEVDVLGLPPDASAIQRAIAVVPFVARRRADIVHLSCGRSGLRSLIRGTGAKHVISHVHGFPDEWIGDIRARHSLPLRSTYVDASTHVVACSRWVAQAFEGLTRLTVVPYGIPLPAPNNGGSTTNDDVVVGFLGRLVPQKGLDYLVAAAKLVLERRERVRFLIAGDGPMREEVERISASFPAGRWTLTGPREDVDRFMREIDMLVVPSEWEAFGIVAIEAQASRRPVVAFDVDGLPEAVVHGATGLLTPHRDSAALADAIINLADDASLRAWMGANGRARVASSFSAPGMVRRLSDLYAALISGSTPNIAAELQRD
jgi:glycosyltransferase involved in cell wall biosynthesis